MNIQEAFRILDIPPTRDKKIIKKAYAVKTRQYHPEEYPQQWSAVRSAYEAALTYVDSSEYKGENQVSQSLSPEKEISIKADKEPSEVRQKEYQEVWQKEKPKSWQTVWQEDWLEARELEQLFNQLEEQAEERKKDDRVQGEKEKQADKPVRLGWAGRIPKGVASVLVIIAFCARIFRILDRMEDRTAGQSTGESALLPEIRLLNEEEDRAYSRESVLMEYLRFLYIGQDTELLREQLENSIMLQEGIYLSEGNKAIQEDGFILREIEAKIENPQPEKEYYAFEIRNMWHDGPYILYIDTASLGLEECTVSHSSTYADYWKEYDSWADREDDYGRYYYQLENCLAVIVDVNLQETTKEAYQILLEGNKVR